MNAPRGGEVHSHSHSHSHSPSDSPSHSDVPQPVTSGAPSAVPAEAPPGAASLRALVVTASNRASQGVYADKGGPVLAEGCARSASRWTARGWSPTGTPWRRPCARAWPPRTTSS